jgi:ribosomal-protein-alanine N-acetyltransferase
MTTPILETSRLILRSLTIADAEAANKWTSDPDVTRYMIYTTHKSLNETIEWLKGVEQNIDCPYNFSWGFVLKETGELFGSGGVVYKESRGMFSVGYNIMKEFWGRGLTTEAAREMVDFAAQKLGAKTLYSSNAIENPASGRVLEKIGFVYQNDDEFTKIGSDETFRCREYLLTF